MNNTTVALNVLQRNPRDQYGQERFKQAAALLDGRAGGRRQRTSHGGTECLALF
ncbi:MAG: hypothetical protein KatS3mg045_1970 [Bellilinea sp.]|jgi:hypothetical protein|nr:MAG: hypothetical protein KatS3mg045_1970 [Bellilinea sp.]